VADQHLEVFSMSSSPSRGNWTSRGTTATILNLLVIDVNVNSVAHTALISNQDT
jgi:hypothetical protein